VLPRLGLWTPKAAPFTLWAMQEAVPESAEDPAVPSLLADQLPVARHLDPAASLTFRTPLENHPLSADNKAATILTLLGLMFTILGRYAADMNSLLRMGGWERPVGFAILMGFAVCSFGAVVQAFRTISPRFPRVPPSLAFFGDIARLGRDEYIAKVEALSDEEALDQMLLYNHTTSTILIEKFRQLRRTFRLFQGAAACWVLLMVLLTWGKLH
jgi:hypothetical protein